MPYNPNDASSAPIPPHHLPSPAELGAVASNQDACVASAAGQPSVADILQPVLNSCSEQWHADFLFTPDPIHVAHLDAHFSNRALLSVVTTTRAASPALQPAPASPSEHDSHAHAYVMMLPVFTVDHTTVGVGVISGIVSDNLSPAYRPSAPHVNSLCVNMRFLLDARAAVLLVVYDAPAAGLFVFSGTCFNGNTAYRTHKAIFRRDSFLRVVRGASPPPPPPRAADLMPALLSFEDEFFPVNCPMCGSPPPTQCTCSLALPRATHPLDLAYVIRAITPHMGSFEGVVVKHLDPLNKPGMQVVLGIRTAVHSITDVSIMTQMGDWSLSDHTLRIARTSSPRASGRMSSRAAADLMQQFAVGLVQPPTVAADFDLNHQHAGDHRHASGNTSDVQPRPPGHAAGDAGMLLPVQGNNVYIVQQGDSNKINIGADVMGANVAAGGYERNNIVIVQSGRSNEISIGTHMMTGAGAAAAGGHLIVGAAGNAAGAQHVCVDDEARKQELQRVTLADIVRRHKGDIRKERNRESAKRSNLRKKRQRADLEESLCTMKERAAELRARELELRDENRRLRELKRRQP